MLEKYLIEKLSGIIYYLTVTVISVASVDEHFDRYFTIKARVIFCFVLSVTLEMNFVFIPRKLTFHSNTFAWAGI